MPLRIEIVPVPIVAAMVAVCGCVSTTGFGAEGGPDGGASDVDRRETDVGDGLRGDAVDEEAGGPVSGPLVLVTTEARFLEERFCDLDGDGTLDNAMADLGSPGSGLLAMALNSGLAGAIERGRRTIVHFSAVDDLSGPETTDSSLFVYSAYDTDEPRNPDDDFSGTEPFYADPDYVDSCGEPDYRLEHAVLDDGALHISSGTIAITLSESPTELSAVQAAGRVEPYGTAADVRICGYASAQSLGESQGLLAESESGLLEEFLSGGAILGFPEIPGLELDVDADGDGLERIILDDDGHITSCVDGDNTEIRGSDCWMDRRIADGISLVLELDAVGARFAGRRPGWEYRVPHGSCPEGPPSQSLFGPLHEGGACAPHGELCAPWTESPCCAEEDRCSGANGDVYRCLAPCDPSRCDYGEVLGSCRNPGLCYPVVQNPDGVDCEEGSGGCTTDYGESSDTTCTRIDARSVCLEACSETSNPCSGGLSCAPLAFEEAGVCVIEEDDR